MIKVLIVEDSPSARDLLVHLLVADPRIKIVGCVRSGEEAVEAAMAQWPDVITMDVMLPGIDGMEANGPIMETQPTPIVIVSASTRQDEVDLTFVLWRQARWRLYKSQRALVIQMMWLGNPRVAGALSS